MSSGDCHFLSLKKEGIIIESSKSTVHGAVLGSSNRNILNSEISVSNIKSPVTVCTEDSLPYFIIQRLIPV
jgi:hypothetical protein